MADRNAPEGNATDAQAASEEASVHLSFALSLLEVMQDRFCSQSEALHRVFGGIAGTDANALHAIRAYVESAKDAIDGRGTH